MLRVIIAFVVAAALAGCATTYGEMSNTGGVAAAPITNDTYRISARGNGFTDATTIQDYVMLKAAETTLASGHTHFQVLSGKDATTRARRSDKRNNDHQCLGEYGVLNIFTGLRIRHCEAWRRSAHSGVHAKIGQGLAI